MCDTQHFFLIPFFFFFMGGGSAKNKIQGLTHGKSNALPLNYTLNPSTSF